MVGDVEHERGGEQPAVEPRRSARRRLPGCQTPPLTPTLRRANAAEAARSAWLIRPCTPQRGEPARLRDRLDRPRHEQLGARPQLLRRRSASSSRRWIETPVEPVAREARQQPPELARAADGVHDADVRRVPRAARAARQSCEQTVSAPRRPCGARSRASTRAGSRAIVALEVEHQLGAGGRPPRAGPRAAAAAPTAGASFQRSHRMGIGPTVLQVAHLEAAREEVDVSLDERQPQRLGGAQPRQVVAGAVRDDERRRGRSSRVPDACARHRV